VFCGLHDGVPTWGPAKQPLETASEEQAEYREYEYGVAEARNHLGDHFANDGVRADQAGHGENRDPGEGQYAGTERSPIRVGASVPSLLSLSSSFNPPVIRSRLPGRRHPNTSSRSLASGARGGLRKRTGIISTESRESRCWLVQSVLTSRSQLAPSDGIAFEASNWRVFLSAYDVVRAR
jgi:hypothetical protein